MSIYFVCKAIRYRKISNNIQQIRNDLKDIEGKSKILVKADKSADLYKITPNRYN